MPLRDEILEQPTAIQSLLDHQEKVVKQITKDVGHPAGIFIAARGTSDNAARYAKYVWGANNQIPVTLAAPSLFSVYHKPPILGGMLVVGISQSGESPDLLAVINEANRQGCPTLTITNQPTSPLAKQADYVLDLQAGQEISVAATKSYTCQLAAIAMLSASWMGEPYLWDDIYKVPEAVNQTLNLENQIQIYSSSYRLMDQCVILGRGYNYATAFEWSLKMKELAYVVAQPYSSADFLHGPIALVSSGFPVFAIAHQGDTFPDMTNLLRKLKGEYRANLFLISDNQELLSFADCPVPIPGEIPEWLSPIIAIIPAQLFSYHLTLAKGINPDAPRGLSKITLTK